MMRSRISLPFARGALLLLAILLCACASGGRSSGRQPAAEESVILASEIESSQQPTLYDVVRALRPLWLRTQPTTMKMEQESGVTVYLDNQRAGGVEVLQQMRSSSAASLRFFSASEAQSRFGMNNMHGVIQIVSKVGSSGS